jgi:hypothetical protein
MTDRQARADRIGLMSAALIFNGIYERKAAIVVLHEAGFRPAEVAELVDRAVTAATTFAANYLDTQDKLYPARGT